MGIDNSPASIYNDKNKIHPNRRSGDNGATCSYRERGMLETPCNAVHQMDRRGRSQRGLSLSILRRDAYVSCEEYVCIPQSARAFAREARWHRE